jgi:hypothetical protein
LRRFLREPPAPPEERCELCSKPVPDEHPHLVDPAERRMLCACQACGMLFVEPGRKFRRVPDRYLRDPDFVLSDTTWEELQIPVGMAFFLHNSAQDQMIACYPSPAGATESELTLDSWSEGIGGCRLAGELTSDVEALLVRRADSGRSGDRSECLLVPIDACYRLVGLVRLYWKGFDGGFEAWNAIDAFFAELRAQATSLESHRA